MYSGVVPGVRNPGYSPRPTSGPRYGKRGIGVYGRCTRGKEPLAIHRGPLRGRGMGKGELVYTGVVPGVRNPWLFTAAHFGAGEREKGG